MGERLAWVCLMCDAKRKGRGGKVSIRKSVFQKHHRLTGRAVDGMLHRAQKCGAIEINGDFITLCNWRTYQQKMGGARPPDLPDSPKIQESAPTKDTSPTTTNQGHITKESAPKFVKPTLEEVKAYVLELGYTMDAEKFWYHFEARGWRTREGTLKSWKAAVVNWQKNEKSYGANHGTNTPRVGPGQRYRG